MSYGLIRRLSESARSSVIRTEGPEARPLRLADLRPGWTVSDLTGRAIGRVASVDGRGLVVRRGIGRGSTIVPADQIAELHEGEVRLTVCRDELR
jgi:hypothetical protein